MCLCVCVAVGTGTVVYAQSSPQGCGHSRGFQSSVEVSMPLSVCACLRGGGEKVRWSRICVNYTDIAAFPWRYVSFCLDIPWFMEACKKKKYIAVTCLTWSWQPEGDRWFTMTERHREHKEREREGMKTISHSWQVLLQALSPWNCSTTWLLRGRPTSPNT